MTHWTPSMHETLLNMHPTHNYPDIAAAIFGSSAHKNAVASKARRLGLKTKPPIVHPIDNAKFVLMWSRGDGITHICHVCRCSSEFARQHARKLGLPERRKHA